jgi:hypothetical protein
MFQMAKIQLASSVIQATNHPSFAGTTNLQLPSRVLTRMVALQTFCERVSSAGLKRGALVVGTNRWPIQQIDKHIKTSEVNHA